MQTIEVSYSFVKSSAEGLQERWLSNLKDARLATSRQARQMIIEDMTEVYEECINLKDRYQLHPIHLGMLQHILDRPLKDHITLLINTTDRNHFGSF